MHCQRRFYLVDSQGTDVEAVRRRQEERRMVAVAVEEDLRSRAAGAGSLLADSSLVEVEEVLGCSSSLAGLEIDFSIFLKRTYPVQVGTAGIRSEAVH